MGMGRRPPLHPHPSQVHWTVQDLKAMPFVEPGLLKGRKLVAQVFHARSSEGELSPIWQGEVRKAIAPQFPR